MKIDYQTLEKKIKIDFKNKDLLIRSLTHKALIKKKIMRKSSFLEIVFRISNSQKNSLKYIHMKKGILDKKFASLVNKKTCLDVAKNICLQNYVTFASKRKKFY